MTVLGARRLRAAKDRLDGDGEDWLAFKCLIRANDIPVCGICLTTAARWNDDPERTHDEVLAAFDRAIAAAGP
jgi:hypothetical protein